MNTKMFLTTAISVTIIPNSYNVEKNWKKYVVFGLGNKTYEHFNAMAKFVDSKLGGQRIHTLGLGDDDANLEENFITW
jgi:NADPH-ferrihemoprotein reductase